MNYFKQIYYEMKHQRMMTWVSISGTALAIFLVMAFIMADRINTVEVAPESNRARILQATGLHIIEEKNEGSTWGLNYKLLDRLYGNLDGIEMVCYQYAFDEPSDVNVKNGEILSMPSKRWMPITGIYMISHSSTVALSMRRRQPRQKWWC